MSVAKCLGVKTGTSKAGRPYTLVYYMYKDNTVDGYACNSFFLSDRAEINGKMTPNCEFELLYDMSHGQHINIKK